MKFKGVLSIKMEFRFVEKEYFWFIIKGYGERVKKLKGIYYYFYILFDIRNMVLIEKFGVEGFLNCENLYFVLFLWF